MLKFVKILVITFSSLLAIACVSQEIEIGSSEPPPLSTPSENESFEAGIPKETWEPIFFEAIDLRTARAGIPKLRTLSLSNNDIEVRVWAGFGKTLLEGFTIKRIDGK